MSFTLSNRVKSVKPSPTLAITARAAAMRAAGKDIIGLGAGEPDFDTPAHIKTAAIQAINNGFTKYTAVRRHRRPQKSHYQEIQTRQWPRLSGQSNTCFLWRQAKLLQSGLKLYSIAATK